MLMKYPDEKFYPELSICVPLILEVWMVIFSLTYPTYHSRTEKKLNISKIIILRLQHLINLSGEIFSPMRLPFQ